MGGIYSPTKISARWQQERAVLPVRSTARSTGPTVIFMTVVPPVDRPVNRAWNQRATALWPVDRPVDRSWIQRAEPSVGRPGPFSDSRTLCRSTDPVDRGHFQRAELSGGRPTRSTGPPAQAGVHTCARRSTASTSPVDRQTASPANLG